MTMSVDETRQHDPVRNVKDLRFPGVDVRFNEPDRAVAHQHVGRVIDTPRPPAPE